MANHKFCPLRLNCVYAFKDVFKHNIYDKQFLEAAAVKIENLISKFHF